MAKSEEMILRGLISLEEGKYESIHGYYVGGRPMFVVFYDRKNRGCILVDIWRLSDACNRRDEERLARYVQKRPERFIELPANDSRREFETMCDFAWKKKIPELQYALGERRPMREFRWQVTELGLDEEWAKFRDDVYCKMFEEWEIENEIE